MQIHWRSSQYIRRELTTLSNITDGPAIFNQGLLDANVENNLRHYLSTDDTIDPTDYTEFIYNTAIAAASNRYVVITERNGNNEMSIQALDATLNPTGNIVLANAATYIDTGAITDFGQNVFVTIYPLTALVSSGTDIQGIRITQTGAAATSGDGGDGKAFIIYDASFLTPPPTILPSTAVVQPDCLTNLGSITVDATDNGGGAMEYSINGLAGPFQASPIFTNLAPGPYTVAVRYVATPTCVEEAIAPIVLDSADCSISLIKSVASVSSLGSPGILDDEITYSFTVTNTGDETLTNITVTDPIVGTVTCVATTLVSGASTTCSATYIVLQSDIDAGGVENSAIVTAEVPGGDTGNTADDIIDTSDTGTESDGTTAVVDPATEETLDIDGVNGDSNDADPTNDVTPFEIPANPSIELVKSVASVTAAGGAGLVDDVINYSFTVTNTGNVTLTDIAVNDPVVGTVTCVATSLAPGASTTCSASYTVLQSDVDAGGIENTATVSSEGPGGDTGNTADDVTDVSDTGTESDGTTVVVDPATEETEDINGVNGDNTDLDPTNDVTPFEIPANPSIELVKSVASVTAAGGAGLVDDVINYSFTVTNTGNVTLTDIAVNDPVVGTVTCVATSLAPGASTTCSASYTVLQSDVDAGGIENTATVSSEGPGGDTGNTADDVTDVSDTGTESDGTTVVVDPATEETEDIDGVNGDNNDADPTNDVTPFEIPANPSIELVKSVASVRQQVEQVLVDDVINYSFTVTNTGNVTLTDISVNDPVVGTVTCVATSLAPGASTTCSAELYGITE